MTKQASTTKQVNYTDDQVATLMSVYGEATTDEARKEAVETLAKGMNKHPASIRAKLSSLGVYVKAKPTTKAGKAIVSKADLVSAVAKKLDVNEDVIGSLEKATKQTIQMVLDALSAE